VTDLNSPWTWAFSLIGIHEYLRQMKDGHLAKDTGRLTPIFDKVAE
jgi:hypothetical protein